MSMLVLVTIAVLTVIKKLFVSLPTKITRKSITATTTRNNMKKIPNNNIMGSPTIIKYALIITGL